MLKTIVIIETLLLVLVIFLFPAELFTTGARVYLTFRENPEVERKIGDYYYYRSKAYQAYSDVYYEKAQNGFNQLLKNNLANEKQPAHLKMALGRMYECGKGMKQNLSEARRLYEEALQIDGSNVVLQETIERIKKAQAQPGLFIPCEEQQETYYIEWK